MKKILLFATLITLISANTFSQGPSPKKYKEPLVQDKEFYLKKARKNNIAGGVLIGTGTILLVTGIISYQNSNNPNDVLNDINTGPAIFAMVAGGACVVTSIPLFIAGNKNKKMAESMTVNFQGQKIPQLSGSSIALRYIPSLSLKINF